MAIWDKIWHAIRLNEDDEKKRDQQGGIKNKAAGFVDDLLDVGGRAAQKAKPVTDFAVDLARGVPRGGMGFVQSLREESAAGRDIKLREDLDNLKTKSYDDRKKLIESNPSIKTTLRLYGLEDPTDDAIEKLKQQSTQAVENSRSFKPDNAAEKFLLGSEPVESLQKRREGYQKAVETSPGWSGVKDEAKPLSYVGALGSGILDLPSVGSGGKTVGKKLVKELAKEGDETFVREALHGKFTGDVIDRIAPAIARTTDEKQIRKITDAADGQSLPRTALDKVRGRDRVANAIAETEPVAEASSFVTRPGMRQTADDLTGKYDVNRPSTTPSTLPSRPAPVAPSLADDDPVKPLVDLQNADQDVLSRIKSSDEIDKLAPKKSWKQRFYEGLFNRDAPLDTFAHTYKDKTGKDLKAEDDPAAYRQLANGLDDMTKQQLQPVLSTLGNLYKGGTDDVRVLGESRQILDRADKYAPEIVQRAQAAVKAVEGRLTPEQLQQANDAVGAVSQHHDTLMRMLVDSGDLTDDAYQKIKATNPNFFSKRNIVEYLANGANRDAFSSRSSNVARDKVVQAVKGIQDDNQYQILDPLESMLKTTRSVLDRVNRSKMFDAARAFKDIDPSMVVELRDADTVAKRIGLSSENSAMRAVSRKVDRLMSTRERWLKKLQTEVGQMEKQGLHLSLKSGGTEPTPAFTPAGMGGAVPTSKAGKTVPTTAEEKSVLANTGTDIPVNPSKLGPRDTAAFVRSLVEAPRSEIEKIRSKIGTREGKVNDLLDELSGLSQDYDDATSIIRSNKDEFQGLLDKDVPKGFKAVSRIRNGVVERIALPEEIADTWMGLNEAQRDSIGKFSKYFSQPLRAATTTLSLPFQFVKNPIRDARQTAYTSKAIPVGDYVLVLPYLRRWAGGLMEALKDSPLSKEVRSAGGGGAGVFNDYDKSRDVIKDLDRKVNGPELSNPKGLFEEAKRILGKVYGGAERAGRALEYAPRLAEARAIREKGGSIEEAARGARNVTVDFNSFGKEGRVLNDYLLFFNTRLQGNRNVISAIKNNPKRAAIVTAANIAMPAASIYAWNTSQHPDTYEQISQDVKDNNFILILGDEKDAKGNFTQVLKIPKNEADKVFGNITDSIMASLTGKPEKSAQDTAVQAAANVLPVDVAKDGDLNLSRAVGSVLPAPLKAAAESATNHSFYYDAPIVPDSMKNLPPEMQVRDSTSNAAKFVAGLTGGSPIKTDAAIRSTTGNLLTQNPVNGVGDAVTGARGGAATDKFYGILDKVSVQRAGASKQVTEAIAAGDTAKAHEIATEYNSYLQEQMGPWAKRYGQYATPEMQDLYDKQKLTVNKRSIKQRRTASRKKAQLEEAQ